MHLRIVGGLFTATIVDKIDAFPSTGGEKSQTDRLYHILTKEGRIHIKRTKLQKKSNSLDKPDWRKVSFAGTEATILCHLYPVLLDVVHPRALREEATPAGRDANKSYQSCLTAWALWVKTWRILQEPLQEPTSQEARDKRAEEVEAAGTDFVDAWVRAHKRTQGVYVHLLTQHVPDMIRKYGCLRPYSAQGLEHSHSVRKLVGRMNTNKRKGGENGRMTQKLSWSVLGKHTTKVFRKSLDLVQWGREKQSRLRRAAKYAEKQVQVLQQAEDIINVPQSGMLLT